MYKQYTVWVPFSPHTLDVAGLLIFVVFAKPKEIAMSYVCYGRITHINTVWFIKKATSPYSIQYSLHLNYRPFELV